MTRGNARELAVHLIYSQEFTGEDPEAVIAARLDKEYYQNLAAENELYADQPKGAQLRYIDGVVSGVANRVDDLNAEIQKFSIGWDVSRISRISRAILQLAIYEIQNLEDVPVGVSIAEAVRLAKKLDSDEAGAFVNGILGSYARSMTSESEAALVEENNI